MSAKRISFDPAKDIPSQEGKVILITGGNAGIGKQTALELAKHNPSQIWIAARNEEAANATIEEIHTIASQVSVRFVELDLASFDSVKKAASTFIASASRLDILFLNSGIMGGPATTTKEGYELRFGVNHMGHALLFKLLTPLLLKTAAEPGSQVRIVILSSEGHKSAPTGGIHFDKLKSSEGLGTVPKYCQSKLANLLYARELAKKYPQLTIVPIDPGAVKTELFQSNGGGIFVHMLRLLVLPIMGVSVIEGAKNSLWTATAENVVSGVYYTPIGSTGKDSALSKDEDLIAKLWEFTEKELEGHDI